MIVIHTPVQPEKVHLLFVENLEKKEVYLRKFDTNNAFPGSKLYVRFDFDAHEKIMEALEKAEAFIAGFEDDPVQEDMSALAAIRNARKLATEGGAA